MNRAERRRIERAARKMNLDGVSENDIQRAVNHAELRDQISMSVRMEQFAQKVVQKQNEQDLEEIQKAAANQAYMDWLHKFEKVFVQAFLVSFAMAVHDKFPNWGTKPIEEMVSRAAAWNDRFIVEYKRDIIAFKNLYAICFGAPLQLQLVDLDEPVIDGKDVPKSELWKVMEEKNAQGGDETEKG